MSKTKADNYNSCAKASRLMRFLSLDIALLASTVVSMIFFSNVCWQNYSKIRSGHTDNAIADARLAVTAFADRTMRLFDSADGFIKAVRSQYVQSGDVSLLRRFIEEVRPLHADASSGVLMITDPNGKIVYNSETWGASDVNLSEVDHFKFFRANPTDTAYISPTRVGRFTNKYQFRLVRPILHAGAFDGDIFLGSSLFHVGSLSSSLPATR